MYRLGEAGSVERAAGVDAAGDALRGAWANLGRVPKWGFGIVLFGLLAMLPLATQNSQ